MLPGCRSTTLLIGIAFAVTLTATQARAQPASEPVAGSSSFIVFLRAAPVGTEQVALTRTNDGWMIESGGQLSAPISRESILYSAEYDHEWHPKKLRMAGIRNGERFLIESQLDDGTAINLVQNGTEESRTTLPVAATAIFLPDFFFGAYEALAVRLQGFGPGDALPVFVAPRGPIRLTVEEVLSQELDTSERRFQATIYRITLHYTNGPISAEVWVDDRHRLLRVTLPVIGLDVVRQDISLVSTRLAGIDVPGDEEVLIRAAGFSLSTTVTTPHDRTTPPKGWPVVILVPGIESIDRDEPVAGVPIYGHLARALASAGYCVVRYDRRGVGRSGGRPESSTIEEYAEDVRAIVDHLEDQDAVDDNRIAIIAHGEGGWIGLRAASREKKIAAAVLLAVPAIEGGDLVLEQQRAALERLRISPEEREDRIALQRRIHTAVLNDGSWDEIPQQFRRQADTLFFKSFLEYEPADVVRRTRQPLLILHGMKDEEIHPYHADHLATLARIRKPREATVDLTVLPDVNHALLNVSESSLGGSTDPQVESLSKNAVSTIVTWLDRVVVTD